MTSSSVALRAESRRARVERAAAFCVSLIALPLYWIGTFADHVANLFPVRSPRA